jgi:putative colanic acid biosynthesis UDP-glucose lipid carrier transferase
MKLERPRLSANEPAPSTFRFLDTLLLVFTFLLITSVYDIVLNSDYWLLLTANLALFSYLAESLQLYKKLRLGKFTQRVMRLFAALTLTFLVVMSLLFLVKEADNYSRFLVISWYFASFFALFGWRVIYRALKRYHYTRGENLRRVAIVGLTPTGHKLYKEIDAHKELGLTCIGFFDDREVERLDGQVDKLIDQVNDAVEMAKRNEIDSLYICLPLQAEKRIADIIRLLGDSTVSVFMVPDFLLNNLMHGNISSLGDVETISVFESPVSGFMDFYKRAFDILFSVCALIGLSPVLLVIALVIKFTSPGPILFRQDRYGLDGKPIGVYKFRSMQSMDNGEKVKQATKNDSRITPVGAFLRRTSLDELPQFFNVLMGDMSVVGPRPHAVAHNEEYRKLVDYYMLRHKVRPGITGWAQVNGFRGETDTLEKMEKRIEYDLQYIRNWSIWWDFKIIFMTVFKGFINKNAY